jgi:hypothetical protein
VKYVYLLSLKFYSPLATGRVYEADFVDIIARAQALDASPGATGKKKRASPAKPREKKAVAKSISKRVPKKEKEQKKQAAELMKREKKEEVVKKESKTAAKNKVAFIRFNYYLFNGF